MNSTASHFGRTANSIHYLARPRGWARTLIIVNHKAFRKRLVNLLQGYAAALVIAEGEEGLEAVRKAQELEPDPILLDIGLSRLNGFDVARQIRRTVPNVEIIFITANNDP